MLLWDGLRIQIPETMAPATLDRGFIRLVGSELPTVNLRFGAEKQQFHPHRDGRRILRASGLAEEPLEKCRKSWSAHLRGDLYCNSRLYIVHFTKSRSLVAALFSAPPPPGTVEEIFMSLAWTPTDSWRRWCCYDITFETPPEYLLSKAVFQPGRFGVTVSKGCSVLRFDRFAPANVLLGGLTLHSWCREKMCQEIGAEVTINPRSDTETDFSRSPSLAYRIFPRLPGLRQSLRGKIRHLVVGNKILVLTEEGPFEAELIASRLHSSYANFPVV